MKEWCLQEPERDDRVQTVGGGGGQWETGYRETGT